MRTNMKRFDSQRRDLPKAVPFGAVDFFLEEPGGGSGSKIEDRLNRAFRS
jgi:hypothetical protein